MKTVFDKAVQKELIGRINMLNDNCLAVWGKMNAYQMVKHCRMWEEMIISRKKYKQVFIGRLFGKMALKEVLKDGVPLRRGTPTLPELVVTGSGDIATEKHQWMALIEQYDNYADEPFLHPFFGNISKEQIGYIAYKHSDHHLRQFNC